MLRAIGIGAQKSGTTWLYERLRTHPEVAFPAGKEVHFWNANIRRGVDWYRSLFSCPEKCEMEITPAYGILPSPTIAAIAREFPGLRPIYLIRNPIERAWSSAKMAMVRAELKAKEASLDWFRVHFHSEGSVSRGDHEANLRRWREFFPADQIKVVMFEDIKSDPKQTLLDICNHIGVNGRPYEAKAATELAQPVFMGPEIEMTAEVRNELIKIYERKIEHLGFYLGKDLSGWLRIGQM
jgi:hypothetical protein